ncbi:MAG: type II toxin-antitoxin system RelE/ParE family toxin [Planctomycetes bacterium]|nr:type II toxin-antitoxin system RelE/ParE family toxin [Planctomycetota bacterium]
MDKDEPRRPVHWVGSSLEDLKACPEDVKDEVGHALYVAQVGEKHESAKPLKGFGGAGVLEVVTNEAGSTYRAVYTVKFPEAIYVLHVFQKKSKQGIQSPKEEIDLVKRRLRAATEDHEQRYGGKSHGRET